MKTRIICLSICIVTTLLTQEVSGWAQNEKGVMIRRVFQKYTQEEGVRNAFFRMESSKQQIPIEFVYGKFKSGDSVTANTPFYTASIGKTFTATAIGLLVDEGGLSFDDFAIDHLGDLVKGLSMINGVDYSDKLTIHHLLSHTSGLPDYFEDQPVKGVNMMQKLLMEPNRFWEPQALIDFTKGAFQAHFKPGDGYHYTDTEYVLLGLIIEKVSGMRLYDFFQERIFKPFSLSLTSMNLRSEPIKKPDFPMAEIYAGPMEISTYRSLSADWAGGAIRSSGKDLNSFLKALVSGEVVSEANLEKMKQWTFESQGTYYGYGLRKWALKELSSDFPEFSLVGHSGSTGAFMYYCPELDVYLSGTFNNTDFLQKHILFLTEVLTVISQETK
ncbi:serine hydrolase domain-containing protein [Roseivirga sp.]|uniref:serine hydrolase domain-containing protein n=1 Tax=Roseivirga sp. TaxID=1964215 RepID=UPI003B8D0D9A